MTNVTKTNLSNSVQKNVEKVRTFVGRAWINELTKGEKAGTKFINITLDRDTQSVLLNHNIQIQLWPNSKREGKENDADYRLSIVEPVATA